MGRRYRSALAAVTVLAAVGVPWIVAPSTVGAGNSGIIEVTKVVGPGAPSDPLFVVTVSCEGLGDQEVDFGQLGGVEIANVPADYQGTCTFTETTTSGGTPSYACDGLDTIDCETTDGPDPTVVSIDNPGVGVIGNVTVTNSFQLGSTEPDPASAALALEAAPSFTG